YKQDRFESYDKQMDVVRSYVKDISPDQWQENVYWGWMDVVRHTIEPKGKGYPSVMQTAAWQDKSLNSALGSWSELRHDTVLYAHQVTAECGEGGTDEMNRPPRGYVEPDIKTYHRLRFLNNQLWKGLKSRKFLDDTSDQQMKDL